MTKKLILADKIYNFDSEDKKQRILANYKKYLHEKTKGFPRTSVKINKLRAFDNRIEVRIHGPEEIFLHNLLKKEIGTIVEFDNVQIGNTLKGFMTDVGKVGFGIFVNCAVVNPYADVLLNLHTLREQLCNNKKKSIPEIIKAYNFIDRFPVVLEIVEKEPENTNLRGKLTSSTLDLFKKITDENLEGIFVSGATKNQFKKVLLRQNHLRDIVSIERFGFLENIVLLKEGTDAPGIIYHIGRYLRNCKMSALRPNRMKKLFL
ncbi:MAG: DUF2110 family protein [Candidatus Lokiarchaeota archaeon]|nr:DUF2110 family protein [Candidatus Lokiarchaeota archaeon]